MALITTRDGVTIDSDRVLKDIYVLLKHIVEKSDSKQYQNPRYAPGHWNGVNGGLYYGQYFNMDDVNRVREMTEVASVLAEHGIRYNLTKLKRQYRITISKEDYFRMDEIAKVTIYNINVHHDLLREIEEE